MEATVVSQTTLGPSKERRPHRGIEFIQRPESPEMDSVRMSFPTAFPSQGKRQPPSTMALSELPLDASQVGRVKMGRSLVGVSLGDRVIATTGERIASLQPFPNVILDKRKHVYPVGLDFWPSEFGLRQPRYSTLDGLGPVTLNEAASIVINRWAYQSDRSLVFASRLARHGRLCTGNFTMSAPSRKVSR
jgi:hypothetical protein